MGMKRTLQLSGLLADLCTQSFRTMVRALKNTFPMSHPEFWDFWAFDEGMSKLDGIGLGKRLNENEIATVNLVAPAGYKTLSLPEKISHVDGLFASDAYKWYVTTRTEGINFLVQVGQFTRELGLKISTSPLLIYSWYLVAMGNQLSKLVEECGGAVNLHLYPNLQACLCRYQTDLERMLTAHQQLCIVSGIEPSKGLYERYPNFSTVCPNRV